MKCWLDFSANIQYFIIIRNEFTCADEHMFVLMPVRKQKRKKKKKNNYEYLNWQEARLQVKPTTCSASSASSAQCLECTLEKWVVNFDRTCKNNNKFLMHVHMFLVLLDRSDLSFFQNHMHYDIRFRKPPL